MRFERNRDRRIPELNMASLPDLIFTVLFFFMIVTSMRSVPMKVRYQTPEGHGLTEMKKQSSTLYLFIGKPILPNGKTGDTVVVQVNDRYVSLDKVADHVAAFRENLLPDEQEMMTVSLKIDKNVPMGIVTDVKMALRKAGALKVHYHSSPAIREK
ncbi:MAG: biopolymer transporter ExbD [Prevotella sp.]|nr:biopolymer transporter ExbD [Prevotella sp.]